MITLVAFVVLVLATARLTRAVSIDSLTAPIREWIGRKYGETSLIHKLIWCYWCAGWWVAGFTSLLAQILAVTTHQLSWWVAALTWLLLWPATAYASSWVLDQEKP